MDLHTSVKADAEHRESHQAEADKLVHSLQAPAKKMNGAECRLRVSPLQKLAEAERESQAAGPPEPPPVRSMPAACPPRTNRHRPDLPYCQGAQSGRCSELLQLLQPGRCEAGPLAGGPP